MFVIAFLPRSKCLLISWLQLPSTVILESKKIKSVTIFIVSSSICCEVMGPDAMIFILNDKVIIFPFVNNELTWDNQFFWGVSGQVY